MLEQARTLIEKARRLASLEDHDFGEQRGRTVLSDTALALEEALAKIARMETVLKPFARLNTRLEAEYSDRPDHQTVFYHLSHGDLRRAGRELDQPAPAHV